MAVLMGAMALTGLYDITLIGAAPAWTGLGLALQAAVTEELWMRRECGALSTQAVDTGHGVVIRFGRGQRLGAADPPPKIWAVQRSDSESFLSRVTCLLHRCEAAMMTSRSGS